MNARPSIGLVICARDAERYLVETLDSVAAQTRPVDEFVLVDDGSSDTTAAIAADHRTRPTIVATAGLGHPAARNRGVAAGDSDLVAFLDADDLWTPNCLEVLAAALAEHPTVAMAFGHVEQFVSPDLASATASRFMIPTGSAPGYLASSMLIRRSALLEVGPFDESLRLSDYIAWLMTARAAGLGEVVVSDVVLRRRHHDGNLGRTARDQRSDYVKVMHEAIRRRRAVS